MLVRDSRLTGGSSSSFRREMRRPEASRTTKGMAREARGPPWTRRSRTVRRGRVGSERGRERCNCGKSKQLLGGQAEAEAEAEASVRARSSKRSKTGGAD